MLRFLPRPRWPPFRPVNLPDQISPRDGLHVDWHCHSRWSDGQAQIPELVEQAESQGITLGISDHGLMDNVRLQTEAQLAGYSDDQARYPVLRGIEISIGDIEAESGVLDRFDYVIASLHGLRVPEGVIQSTRYLNWRAGLYPSYRPLVERYDRQRYFQSLLTALEETFDRWPVTILGHFCLLPELANREGTYTLDEDPAPDGVAAEWLDAVIALCIQHDVAIELNSKSRAPHVAFVRRALALGARFSLGSDAHQRHRAGDLSYGRQLAQQLGLSRDRLLGAAEVLARRPAESTGSVPAAATLSRQATGSARTLTAT